MDGFWLIILQIGVIDIVFSLDSVFTAIGLANRVEVMVGRHRRLGGVMMVVSSRSAASSSGTRPSRPWRWHFSCWSASR